MINNIKLNKFLMNPIFMKYKYMIVDSEHQDLISGFCNNPDGSDMEPAYDILNKSIKIKSFMNEGRWFRNLIDSKKS